MLILLTNGCAHEALEEFEYKAMICKPEDSAECIEMRKRADKRRSAYERRERERNKYKCPKGSTAMVVNGHMRGCYGSSQVQEMLGGW